MGLLRYLSGFIIGFVCLSGFFVLFALLQLFISTGGSYSAVVCFVLCIIIVIIRYEQPRDAMKEQHAQQYIHDICRQVTNTINQVSESLDNDSAERLQRGLITMQTNIPSN